MAMFEADGLVALVLFAFWVWAIIDVAIRPSSFYDAFPNG